MIFKCDFIIYYNYFIQIKILMRVINGNSNNAFNLKLFQTSKLFYLTKQVIKLSIKLR